MTGQTLAVDVRCLNCGSEVMRAEATPGTLTIPDHACTPMPEAVTPCL